MGIITARRMRRGQADLSVAPQTAACYSPDSYKAGVVLLLLAAAAQVAALAEEVAEATVGPLPPASDPSHQ